MTIARIVSGGQTGADQGAIEAALYTGLEYGGWIPKGRKAEKGSKIPARYDRLREMPTPDYLARNRANVADSDATLVMTYGPATGGSKRTVEFAKEYGKPVLSVDLDRPREEVVPAIVEWLKSDCPDRCVLNCAGSRESKAPGIQDAVTRTMIEVIGKATGTMFYPPHASDAGRWLLKDGKPGDVVRLTQLANGIEPGMFVILDVDNERIRLCVLGEDPASGDMCRTDETVELPLRFARLLKPTKLSLRDG